ncbi:MAG TPA: alkaline phosphatase family protein [Longimicrobiales bacterium]|nr:alkaline phosphatase family protein [Longimicrobiales bacterium]
MPTSKRLAVLALDAAAPGLLSRWTQDGTMPHLASLTRTGLVAQTRSVEGLFVGATWPSFYTGLDPSHHGVYWLDRILPGTYRRQRCTADDLGRHPALWEVLSARGRRVLVLDVPLARRSPDLHGVQIVEWGVHDAAFGFRTTPASLRSRLLRDPGPHPVPSSCDAPRRSTADYRDFADRLARGAAARARLTCDLAARRPWDFLIQVFSECHCAGHQLWHFHDPDHPGWDASAVAEAGDLVRDVYRAVDEAIGRILELVDEDTAVVVTTLHGMAHACGASILLDTVLERLGAVDPPADALPGHPAAPGPRTLLGGLYGLLPAAVRGPLYALRQRANQELLGRGTPLEIDPGRTRAFHVGLGLGSPVSGIRLNLRGREPAGLLEPGPEADRFTAELVRGLRALVDADTGVPVVEEVRRTADLFDGPRVAELPDLLVSWNPDHRLGSRVLGSGAGAIRRITSPRTGTLEAVNTYCRSGEHRIEGMLVARGPGITAGRLGRVVSTLDLAPTFAAMLGCSMPPPAEGRPVRELLGS